MGRLARPSVFQWNTQMCCIFTVYRAPWRKRFVTIPSSDTPGSNEFSVRIHEQALLSDSRIHCGCNSSGRGGEISTRRTANSFKQVARVAQSAVCLSLLIAGPRGSGKSYLMLQAISYCSDENWIVVSVPRGAFLLLCVFSCLNFSQSRNLWTAQVPTTMTLARKPTTFLSFQPTS